MQNNQSIMQISENKDGSAKVLFRIRKAEMADVDEIMAVMHEAKNDKEHPDWFVSDDEEYVRTHIEEQGFVIVAQTADGSVAGFFLIKYCFYTILHTSLFSAAFLDRRRLFMTIECSQSVHSIVGCAL